MPASLVHLVRHGEVHNPRRIRYGRLPGYHLSERGRGQAQRAGQHLRGLTDAIVYASPLERAVETAELVAAELGVGEVLRDGRLIETASAFEGKPKIAPLAPWNWWRLWNPFRPSWGEPFADVATRMLAAIAELRARHPDRALVLVSHQSPIWIARQALERVRPPWCGRVRCGLASIHALRFDGPDGGYAGHSYWAPG